MEIKPNIGFGEIKFGMQPNAIASLSSYSFERISEYTTPYDGRRYIGVEYIGYLFREGGLVSVTLDEEGLLRYGASLYSEELSGLNAAQIEDILTASDRSYEVSIVPYGEGDIDDISVASDGLLFFFLDGVLESVEVHCEKRGDGGYKY